jgi:hypothetical protein
MRLTAIAVCAIFLALLAPNRGLARTHNYHSYRSHGSTHHIHRSARARREFERMTGYPNGRPGYVIDHIVPLACGGADAPSNMQWQTVAAAKAKDKWERKGCKHKR